MGRGTRVGEGEFVVTTSKNLLVRLQAPRVFTETAGGTTVAVTRKLVETGQLDPNLTSLYDLADLMANRYGPMGLEALTVERFVVRGEGQTRNIHG